MPAQQSTFLSVTPMIPTGGTLAEALQFFIDQLGFTVQWEAGGMAGISRGAVSFHLVENNNREWIENASFSIGVSDLDGLYAEYCGAAERISPPEVKSWGRREFHMIVPSGVCLQFYQAAS